MSREGPAGRHRAKRSLGQNFLIDPNLQRKIVETIEPAADDEILEIGPGRGALTRHLAGRVRRLVLVELDDQLAAQLISQYQNEPSVEVVHRDVLALELEEISAHPEQLKVIGNIPYNITTPILFHLLERRPRPARIVLMIQREVADRIVAEPGTRSYGALAVAVQTIAHVERVLHVSRNAFRPVPDVESTVIRITPFAPPPLAPEMEQALRSLTRIAFGQRRKQFQRILRDALNLDLEQISALEHAAGLDLTARPETFPHTDFIRLAELLRKQQLLPG